LDMYMCLNNVAIGKRILRKPPLRCLLYKKNAPDFSGAPPQRGFKAIGTNDIVEILTFINYI